MKDYVLGDSDLELRRLAKQANVFGQSTIDLMRRAGIGPGMRVLDIGSGAGDVGLEVARIVGPTGKTIGIDKSQDAVARANQRAADEGLTWCEFEVGDVESYLCDQPFDALVGRLVLMYLPRPADTVRKLVRNLKPGAIVALQEIYLSAMAAIPGGPLYMQCKAWITAAFANAHADFDMGPKLLETFRDAGLPDPEIGGMVQFAAGPDFIGLDVLVDIIRSLLPTIEKSGIATTEDIGLDTLEERLQAEVIRGCIYLVPPMIGAWAKLPPHGIATTTTGTGP